MDGDLDIHGVGDREALIDGGGGGAPVLVQFQPAGAGLDLILEKFGQAAVSLTQDSPVDRQSLGGLEHPHDVPGARRAGRGPGTGRRSRSTADHGRDPGGDGNLDLLGTDHVDVSVQAPRGADHAFARDHLGSRSNHQTRINARLDQRIAGAADGDDLAVADADVALDDSQVIDDDRVGDHEVDVWCAHMLMVRALPHAVADHLAAAEDHLVAGMGVILLDLDQELGISQADPVADGRAVMRRVGCSGNLETHGVCSRGRAVFSGHLLGSSPKLPSFNRWKAALRTVGSSSWPMTRPLRP